MAATTIDRRIHAGARLGSSAAALIVLALVLGAVAAAAGLGQLLAAPADPAPAFDAVKFRAEERAPLTFDAVKFRAEEKAPLSVPVFDPVKFRAEEKALP